jgi:hypothetical protein
MNKLTTEVFLVFLMSVAIGFFLISDYGPFGQSTPTNFQPPQGVPDDIVIQHIIDEIPDKTRIIIVLLEEKTRQLEAVE